MAQRKYSGTRSKAGRKVAALMLPCPCSICHRVVTADMIWDCDHVVPRVIAEAQGWTQTEIDSPSNLHPSHRSCNTREGGKLSNINKRSTTPRTIQRVVRPSLSFPDEVKAVPLKPTPFPPHSDSDTPQEPTVGF